MYIQLGTFTDDGCWLFESVCLEGVVECSSRVAGEFEVLGLVLTHGDVGGTFLWDLCLRQRTCMAD